MLFLLLSCFSCNTHHANSEDTVTVQQNINEQLIRVNKSQTYSEQSQIQDFVQRYRYDMDSTASGLRYLIYKKTKGAQPSKTSIVEINYEVKLLDGTVCYNSDTTGNLTFQLGKTDLPVGLQQGVELMHIGEKAIFITPSKLGYGLTGDGDMIPPNAVLVYNVELVRVN